MSDLLPFVAAVTNDRAAVDRLEELRQLQRERDEAMTVKVIREANNDNGDDGGEVVCASAHFIKDGEQ